MAKHKIRIRLKAYDHRVLDQSAKRIELASLNPAHPSYSFELPEIAWMHRIIWASQ